jgi:UDP-glucose 4-epimerase
MKALVTGGAGFIGSNLVDALLARGDDVAVVDNLSTGREENLDGALRGGARLRRVDVTDAAGVAAAVEEERPEVIFHLAAQIDVRKSVVDPLFDATVNVGGTINVLEAARRFDVARVINTSTGGAIYGETDLLPTPETAEPLPEAAYGQSKFCAERYCGLFRRLYDLNTVSLRYGNVYGPRQDPLGEAGVIAIFCGLAVSGGLPTVFGDGTQTRDYVYVGDVVAANLAAAERRQVGGEVNIGTGVETSVLEIIDALRDAAGLDADAFAAQIAPARAGEIQRSCLDVTRAREELGWEPRVPLRNGLATTLAATPQPR